MVVGGWFDAEDLFGALRTYEAIEKQSPGNNNFFVMGPWTHGAWAAPDGQNSALMILEVTTSQFFKDSIETVFFNYYLKDKGQFDRPEATVFETGTNQWKQYTSWPPANTSNTKFYFGSHSTLSANKPTEQTGATQYISDPNRPIALHKWCLQTKEQ